MEDVDNTARPIPHTRLHDRIVHLWHTLYQWRQSWDEVHRKQCTVLPTTARSSICLDEDGIALFDTVIHFDTVEAAIDAIYVNVVALFLYSLSSQLRCIGVFPPRATEPRKAAKHADSPLRALDEGSPACHAVEICRLLDNVVQGDHASFGSYILLFPVRVALVHLRQKPMIARWLQRFLGQFTTSQGFLIGRHLLDEAHDFCVLGIQ